MAENAYILSELVYPILGSEGVFAWNIKLEPYSPKPAHYICEIQIPHSVFLDIMRGDTLKDKFREHGYSIAPPKLRPTWIYDDP